MRRNQISIGLERFGDQTPEGAQHQRISVYADANNVWEAIVAALVRLTEEIQRDQPLPSFGRVEGRTRNAIYNPFDPSREREEKSPEEREARIQAWVEKNKEEAECYRRKPRYSPEFFSYAVFAEDKLVVGKPLFVGNKWIGTPLKYRYRGFYRGSYQYKATVLDFAEVVESLFYAPDKFSIKDYESDYSTQEVGLLTELQERLLNTEPSA